MSCRFATSAILTWSALAAAATIDKADNSLPLTAPDSWIGNTVPSPADIARFGPALSTPVITTLGDNLTVAALQLTSISANITLQPDGGTLTLAPAAVPAIDLSATTRTLTLNTTLHLTASQTWDIASTLAINSPITTAAALTVTKSNSGTLLLGPTPSARNFTLNLAGGVLIPSAENAFSSTTNLVMSPNTFLDLKGRSVTLNRFSGAGIIDNSLGGDVILATRSGSGTFSGSIRNTAGTTSLSVRSSSAFTLTGTNTYAGPTVLTNAVWEGPSSLVLSFTTDSPLNNIVSPQSALVMATGSLTISSPSRAAAQSFAGTTLARNHNTLTLNSSHASATFLGAISRQNGATAAFSSNAAGTGGFYASIPLLDSGILPTWLTFGNDWATRSSTNANSPITPLPPSQYSSSFAPGQHTSLASGLTLPAPDLHTESLRLANNMTLRTQGLTVIDSGGILVTNGNPAIRRDDAPATAGLTSGNGSDLIVHVTSNFSTLTIDAPIRDHANTPVGLTLSRGVLVLEATAFHTGPTRVFDGTLRLAADQPYLQSVTGRGVLEVPAGITAASGPLDLLSLFAQGTHTLRPAGTTPTASRLGSVTLTGRLELSDNSLVLRRFSESFPANYLGNIATLIATGTTGAQGITSALVSAHPGTLALAIVPNTDLPNDGFTTFQGLTLDNLSTLLTPALLGDADLSGTVDLADFDRWLQNVSANTFSYARADFNLSGIVDLADFDLWFTHVGASTPLISAAPIPEPSTLALLLPIVLRRRPKHTQNRPNHPRQRPKHTP